MLKNKLLAATLFVAANMSAAQAGNHSTCSSTSNPTSSNCNALIGAHVGGGYFFDLDEAYAVGAIGLDVGCNSFVGLQVMYTSDDQDYDWIHKASRTSGGTTTTTTTRETVQLDINMLTFGPVWRGYYKVGDNGSFYYSASAGLAHYDVDGHGGFTPASVAVDGPRTVVRGNDSDNSYYVDAAVGFQQFLCEDFAFNVGLRLLHLDDVKLEYRGFEASTDFESFYVGVEAGLVFSF